MKIYFAAPLFTLAERAWNIEVVSQISDRYKVFLPQRDVVASDPNDIFIGDLNGLVNCNAVVAILDGADADSGTAWECGYATARGIPVIAVRTDFRTTGDDGWTNLMLTQSAAATIVQPSFGDHDSYTVASEITKKLYNLFTSKEYKDGL